MNHALSMTTSGFDKKRVAQQFSKAAATYARHNELQRDCAQLLLSRVGTNAGKLLDAGCGPAAMTAALLPCCSEYLGVDLAPGMLQQAQQQVAGQRWMLADIEQLPLAANQFDTVVANLVVQWCDDLNQVLTELLRVTKPGGRVLCTTVLAPSMEPLMSTWRNLDGGTHSNNFLSPQACEQSLPKNLTAQAQVSVKNFRYWYASVLQMLRDLKGIGANYTLRNAAPTLTAGGLAQLELRMRNHALAEPDKLPMDWTIGVLELHKSKT
ncbi:MAG: methyltransferase domain-containing protein [Idiomarina sp.]